ncbi:hypothetical protein D9758_010499 [Tetrapyrgos nigripes]|uniref:Glycoside hydrolase family 28 protein n=1 Tax=Tetrapyrgos nigripes TaxID=182062 RepID=A0A8H5D0R4_9AGAR|nr:hypothetical protein D9758_010499 [Tetrapyrgos nigripes]
MLSKFKSGDAEGMVFHDISSPTRAIFPSKTKCLSHRKSSDDTLQHQLASLELHKWLASDRGDSKGYLYRLDEAFGGDTTMKTFPTIIRVAPVLFSYLNLVYGGTVDRQGSTCTVHASDDSSDDAPAIVDAFEMCGQGGQILLHDDLYHIETIMNTTGLKDVVVDLTGTLLWGTNITYFRANSLPLGYQNQSTAWVFGGDNVTFNGHGIGTFDGNGQIWYDFSNGTSNLPGRPINLMIANATASHFDGIRFVQSQFWTMAIRDSIDVLLENIYVNSTSNSSASTGNTDGVDTIFSDRITFRNWTVTCGDDNISIKANSTNILIQDCVFNGGGGVAIGSIGQMLGHFETIENVTAERVTVTGSAFAAYIKTFTGVQLGGGGGLGFAKNLTFRDFTVNQVKSAVAHIGQCTSFEGNAGDCDTSLFQISDITWSSITGSVAGGTLASFQCSGSAPCPGIELVDLDQVTTQGSRNITCSNVVNPVGFDCTQGS